MHTQIPDDVCEILVQHRAKEEKRQRRERQARRQAHAAKQQRRQRNVELAKRILAFVGKFAATGLLPSSGVEIFQSQTGRFTNGAHVYPDGAL